MLLLFENCNKSRFVNIAANNFISLEYLANKYGTGAKYSPAE